MGTPLFLRQLLLRLAGFKIGSMTGACFAGIFFLFFDIFLAWSHKTGTRFMDLRAFIRNFL